MFGLFKTSTPEKEVTIVDPSVNEAVDYEITMVTLEGANIKIIIKALNQENAQQIIYAAFYDGAFIAGPDVYNMRNVLKVSVKKV